MHGMYGSPLVHATALQYCTVLCCCQYRCRYSAHKKSKITLWFELCRQPRARFSYPVYAAYRYLSTGIPMYVCPNNAMLVLYPWYLFIARLNLNNPQLNRPWAAGAHVMRLCLPLTGLAAVPCTAAPP